MGPVENRTVKGYQLGERLGEGGFGVVYRATQLSVGREVAIKAILPVHANKREFIQRFEKEAQLVARLEHPHIVPLIDYWREPDAAYLVMRYLRGGSLRQRMKTGRLSQDEILEVLNHVASALDLAHRSGVIHHDLKPENVLLDSDRNAYLSDFGIAEETAGVRTGGISGSPGYIAPEALLEGPANPRIDIYSLGMILYEMVGGRHPFKSQTARETLKAQLSKSLPPIDDASLEVNDVLRRAVSREPLERQGTALELFLEFRTAVHGRVISTHHFDDKAQVVNPYRGLRAFTEADASVFFGRERLIGQLLARLKEDHPLRNFLAVIGPSGSGKSSVVLAGLVPALRRGGTLEHAAEKAEAIEMTRTVDLSDSQPQPRSDLIIQMVPGNHPLRNLAVGLLSIASQALPDLSPELENDPAALLNALRTIGETTLLVVDQFEEVFTLTETERERGQFLELLRVALTAPDSPLRVVITLRADFTDRPLQYVDFGTLMRDRTEFVLPLSPGELERAIVEPARQVGLQLESELVATIVNDVRNELGALPLMQYALTEAFDRRTGKTIGVAAYQASGGVFGALARRAQEVYDSLSPEWRDLARQIFLRLVTLGEGVRDTRRRVRQSELLKLGGDVEPVLEAFSKYRLIAFDVDPVTREPMVELAHEALLHAWGVLREWLDASRTDIRMHRWLTAAAAEWEKSGRDETYLLSGTRLAQYEEWRSTAAFLLIGDELLFLEASTARQRAQQQAELERQAREQRKGVELQSLALTANSRQMGLQAQPDLALALGVAANRIPSPPDQAVQLLSEIAPMPGTRRVFAGHQDTVWHAAVSPDQREALSASGGFSPASNFYNKMPTYLPLNTRSAPFSDNTVRLWDLATGEQTRVFTGHENTVTAVAFSPDGRFVISASADATIRIQDRATGRLERVLRHPAQVLSIAVREQLLVASSYDFDTASSHLILWDWQSGEELQRYEGQRDAIYSVAISPDGERVLSGCGPSGPFSTHSGDNELVLWDLRSGAVLRRMRGHQDAVFHVAFRPTGRGAVSSSADATLIVWDLDTGEILRTLRGHTTFVYTFAIDPTGDRVFSASFDISIILWDIERGQEIRRFHGHAGPVTAVEFLKDGRRVLTGAIDKTLRLWDIYSADEMLRLGAPPGMGMWALATTGEHVVTSAGSTAIFARQSPVNPLQLWDLRSRSLVATLTEQSNTIFEAVFLPDGKRILTVSGDLFSPAAENWMSLRDAFTGRELRRYSSPGSALTGVALLPDGRHAATIVFGDEILIWDIETGQIVRRFAGAVPSFRAVTVSRDGRLLVTGSSLGILTVWDLGSGDVIHRLEGHSLHMYEVALTADARLAVTVSNDTTAVVWDLTEGKALHRFRQHAGSVQAVAIHPRHPWALTGDDTGKLILWELETGRVLRHLIGHTGGIWDIAFIDDGAHVLTTGGDGNLILWQVAPQTVEQLVAWTSENRYVRDFTPEERNLYRIEPHKTVQ